MSDNLGHKFNRKFYQFKSHLGVTEKTHDADLRAAKDRIKENVALYKQVIKTTEQLMDETRQPYATMADLAVVLGERETHDALDGVGADALAGLERDLIEPLREHLAVYSALQHKVDAVHTLRVDMDRHRERLAAMSRKHTKIEAFQQLQARFNSEKEQYAGLRGEIIAETATLEQERETVTRPIMSTMLVAFSQHLDAVNQRWERVREVLRARQRADDKPAAAASDAPLIAAPPAEERASALYNYDAQEPSELTLREGDTVRILQKSGEWWFGSVDGREGYFPSNYVELVRTE